MSSVLRHEKPDPERLGMTDGRWHARDCCMKSADCSAVYVPRYVKD